jgi:hypothetical protein
MEDWNGSDFFLDRIESVAYRIRTLTKTYRVWVRTVSMKKNMLDRNGTDRQEKIRFVYTEIYLNPGSARIYKRNVKHIYNWIRTVSIEENILEPNGTGLTGVKNRSNLYYSSITGSGSVKKNFF